MKLKRFALKGLIILGVGVALCMFFARTVQTITTPKVRLLSPGKGRLEQEIKLTAEIDFPEKEEITIKEAAKSAVTVSKVYVKPGHYVKKGDVIFTSAMPSYDEDLKKLQDDYNAKAKELSELDVTNRKLSRESRQNELYTEMLNAQDELSSRKYEARKAAAKNGATLLNDMTGWKKQLALVKDVPQEVTDAVNKALAAKTTYEEAQAAFFAVYEDKKLRVNNDTFEYINKRNGLIKDMDSLSDDMLALDTRLNDLGTVRAPRDGWIVSVDVNAGDSYDGSKPAYVMSAKDAMPSLRAPLTGIERTFAVGTRVTVGDDDNGTERTKVSATATDSTGTKYLVIELPESMTEPGNTAVRQAIANGGVQATITYRAKESMTLLPAAAVRSDGNSSYVFLVQQSGGGFLSSNGMKVVKTSVTVADKNDKQVAVQEDFSYQQLAYQEDRALSDGMAVMEYVN